MRSRASTLSAPVPAWPIWPAGVAGAVSLWRSSTSCAVWRRASSRSAARVGSLKKLSSARCAFLTVDHAALEAIEQGLRREIDEDDLGRVLDHPIGNRLADLHAGDVAHLVVEAFEVLDVHRGQHVDAGVKQHDDILPAFGSRRAGDVGVGELVDRADLRSADEDGRGVHLLEDVAAVFDLGAGDQFEAFDLSDGIGAAVGFEVADDDVVAGAAQRLGLDEHPVSLADAGGVSEKDLQPAGALGRERTHQRALPSGGQVREDAHVHADGAEDQAVDGLARQRPNQPRRGECPTKIWVMPCLVA